ncbi:MIR motif-containing protein [Radiomyces spectabilis]|uniref:MIR motif-containing protein n=1 Tax=Radiomyces spectabilis TaxID=64574 RepID=UPI00221FA6C5|nr:MIR motif-containing protein [Radiomyces spectabilis]KAI8377651.1 MIR motif-containing protein [Radiomyces spectabilis]
MSDCESNASYESGFPKDDIVRYGDHIYLKHCATGRLLSSNDEAYEGGSGQQMVFASDDGDENVSVWKILTPSGSEERPGYEVGYDDILRLKHLGTGRHLHSHEIESPITGQQEVSGFGNDDESDDNDLWVLERLGEGDEDSLWHVDTPVILRHAQTRNTLHSHNEAYDDEKNEVTAYGAESDENDAWVATA